MNEKNKKISKKDSDLRKQTIKNIVFKVVHGLCYVCTALFVAVCIVACATANKTKKASAETQNDEIVLVEDIHQRIDSSETESVSASESESYPIYDDLGHTITFDSYQINNYTFENLSNLYESYNDSDLSGSLILYNANEYNLDEIIIEDNIMHFRYLYSDYEINFSSNNYKWSHYDNSGEIAVLIPFQDSIEWVLNSNIYQDTKSAIQLDIQENENTIDVGVFEGLTASIVAFVNTLGVGITNIFSIFLSNGSLTAFGWLTIIFVAVSLTYFVFRLIIGLIRLRG